MQNDGRVYNAACHLDMARIAVFINSKISLLEECGWMKSSIAKGKAAGTAHIHRPLINSPLRTDDPLYWWNRVEFVARDAGVYRRESDGDSQSCHRIHYSTYRL
jgi:hypothetical protein